MPDFPLIEILLFAFLALNAALYNEVQRIRKRLDARPDAK
jgi:hypothetical protein